MTGSRRLLIGLVVAILAAGAAADRFVPPRPPGAGASDAGLAVGPPPNAVSSSWYCAIGGADPAGAAMGEVVVANPGDDALVATIEVIPTDGPVRTQRLDVAPRSRAVTRMADLVQADYAGATVHVQGSSAIVEHGVGGALGFDLAPCVSSPSTRWYLAEGATTKSSTMLLGLFNPFPEDAIADLSFATEQGRAAPGDLQGVVVPGRRLVVVNVGDHVRRREAIATTVDARSGRLVVAKLQLRQEAGQRGLVLTPAAPRAATDWYFPEGEIREGQVERFHVYNPTDREALVGVEVTLDDGAAEPIDIPVAPRDRATVVINEREDVAHGVGHAGTVASLNGVAIVAERTIDADDGQLVGRAGAVGATRLGTRWGFAAGAASEGLEDWIVMQNPGSGMATVELTGLSRGRRLDLGDGPIQVKAGGRAAVLLNDSIEEGAELSVVVVSDEPIAVERALYRIGRTGISITPGVLLAE